MAPVFRLFLTSPIQKDQIYQSRHFGNHLLSRKCFCNPPTESTFNIHTALPLTQIQVLHHQRLSKSDATSKHEFAQGKN